MCLLRRRQIPQMSLRVEFITKACILILATLFKDVYSHVDLFLLKT
jgi:hypothetical protein